MAEALIVAVCAFSSDDAYKDVASIYEDNSSLKEQIHSRTKETETLQAEIDTIKKDFKAHLKKNLDLYTEENNNSKAENSRLTKKITELEAIVNERDNNIGEMSRTIKGLQEHLKQAKLSTEKEKERVTATQVEANKLLLSRKSKETEIENLKANLRTENFKTSKSEDQALQAKKEIVSLRQTLKLNTARLKEIEGYTVKLRDQDESVWTNLTALWESARELVFSHFIKDLPDRVFGDSNAWSSLKESEFLHNQFPLPQSNSPAAKQMRIVVILTILTRSIDAHIFQPTYLEERDISIRQALVHLAVEDCKREAFCRSLLLFISTKEQAENANIAEKQVIQEVGSLAQSLLFGSDFDSFRSGLEQIVSRARQLWQVVQHTREKFEPNFELRQYDNYEWQAFEFEEARANEGKRKPFPFTEDAEELFVVFPPVFLIESSKPKPITTGVVLLRHHTLAASEEVAKIDSRLMNGKSGGKRRMSSIMPNLPNGNKGPGL